VITMPFDPIQEVVNDLAARLREGERQIAVPASWRRYFQNVRERIFGGRN